MMLKVFLICKKEASSPHLLQTVKSNQSHTVAVILTREKTSPKIRVNSATNIALARCEATILVVNLPENKK